MINTNKIEQNRSVVESDDVEKPASFQINFQDDSGFDKDKMEKKRAMLFKKMEERKKLNTEKERSQPEIIDQNISRIDVNKKNNKRSEIHPNDHNNQNMRNNN